MTKVLLLGARLSSGLRQLHAWGVVSILWSFNVMAPSAGSRSTVLTVALKGHSYKLRRCSTVDQRSVSGLSTARPSVAGPREPLV